MTSPRKKSNNLLTAAIIALVLLSGISTTRTVAAFPLLMAESPLSGALPGGDVASQLADKSLAYWFITLAVFSIGSWTYIVKWLISQLESQRQANAAAAAETAAATAKLIEYMSRDHAAVATLTANTLDVLRQVTDILSRVRSEFDRQHLTTAHHS